MFILLSFYCFFIIFILICIVFFLFHFFIFLFFLFFFIFYFIIFILSSLPLPTFSFYFILLFYFLILFYHFYSFPPFILLLYFIILVLFLFILISFFLLLFSFILFIRFILSPHLSNYYLCLHVVLCHVFPTNVSLTSKHQRHNYTCHLPLLIYSSIFHIKLKSRNGGNYTCQSRRNLYTLLELE